MKRFKIVQHWISPEDFLYRVYERECLFFWKYLSGRSSIEGCHKYIEHVLKGEESERTFKNNTPSPEVIKYV